MPSISVACKLPNGLALTHKGKTVLFAGAHSADGGFGLTHGVDADWFDDWIKGDGKDFTPVTCGALFASTAAKVADEAKELAGDIKTGLEPLDGEKPAPGLEQVPETKGK